MGIRLFVAGVTTTRKPDLPPDGDDESRDLTDRRRQTGDDWEGCLSIPDIRGRVPRRGGDSRFAHSTATAVSTTMTASGFAARVIQHETDHLDGILFLDQDEVVRQS